MTLKKTNSLGENLSSEFGCGDVVFWKKLGGEGNIGMVYEVYTTEMGGRQIKKAKVCSFRDTLDYDMLLLELKLVTKAERS
jgi:hypothetical protein